jgi:hypothetical protein
VARQCAPCTLQSRVAEGEPDGPCGNGHPVRERSNEATLRACCAGVRIHRTWPVIPPGDTASVHPFSRLARSRGYLDRRRRVPLRANRFGVAARRSLTLLLSFTTRQAADPHVCLTGPIAPSTLPANDQQPALAKACGGLLVSEGRTGSGSLPQMTAGRADRLRRKERLVGG